MLPYLKMYLQRDTLGLQWDQADRNTQSISRCHDAANKQLNLAYPLYCCEKINLHNFRVVCPQKGGCSPEGLKRGEACAARHLLLYPKNPSLFFQGPALAVLTAIHPHLLSSSEKFPPSSSVDIAMD